MYKRGEALSGASSRGTLGCDSSQFPNQINASILEKCILSL